MTSRIIQTKLAKNQARLAHLKSQQKPGVIGSNAEAVASEIRDLELAIEMLREHIEEGTQENP